MSDFDDNALLGALEGYLATVQALEQAAASGSAERDLLELGQAKSLAGLVLHKRLTDLGWSPPSKITRPATAAPASAQVAEPTPTPEANH